MKFRSLILVALGAVLAAHPAAAHGGVYRGPGSTLGPGGATGGGPAGRTGGAPDTDPAVWSQWWSFNRDRYLALRDAVFAGGSSSSGFDELFLGKGTKGPRDPGLRPSEEQLHTKVVPALLAALEGQRDIDIITASLLALAKIGEPTQGDAHLAEVLRGWLEHSNQEVHETAAIALGILGAAESAPLLADLMLDRPAGRKLSGRGRVPERTRAFAAYGLTLIGYRADADAVRGFVVHSLTQAALQGDQPSRDRMVAAIIGLGVVRLDSRGTPPPSADQAAPVSSSREGQLHFLMGLWADKRLSSRVRAHLPVAMVRLAVGVDPAWKASLVESFVATLNPRGKADKLAQHGVLLAAGLLGDNDQDAPDQRLRAALLVTSKEGDRLGRHLALLALGRVGAREGTGRPGSARTEVRAGLMRVLARGGSAERPWAALAVGLLERGNVAAGHPAAEGTRLALMDAYGKAGSPSEQGALAIALGLTAERRAIDALLGNIPSGDENARANAMIALGLMGAQQAVPLLRRIAGTAIYRPGLVREAAVALGLLGDKSVGGILVARMVRSNRMFEQLAMASALTFIGDKRVLEPLISVLADKRENDTTRAYAAVALGAIGDKELLPWNSKIAADVLWWQAPPTLFDPAAGKGILDIL
jgi:HEAT repeat protein